MRFKSTTRQIKRGNLRIYMDSSTKQLAAYRKTNAGNWVRYNIV